MYRDIRLYHDMITTDIAFSIQKYFETLFELEFWSSISTCTLYWVNFWVDVKCLSFLIWQGNLHNNSCHDIRSYCDINFHDI